jgi:hypothetical protein
VSQPTIDHIGSFLHGQYYSIPPSYYLQHFVDTFRQGVIDLLHGNLEDISEISADDPLEQITQIAQTALVPESRAPSYFNYGALGNDLKFAEDSVIFARWMLLPFEFNNIFHFSLISVTTWHASKIRIGRQPST